MGDTITAIFRKVFKLISAVRDIYCMTSNSHMGIALAGGAGALRKARVAHMKKNMLATIMRK